MKLLFNLLLIFLVLIGGVGAIHTEEVVLEQRSSSRVVTTKELHKEESMVDYSIPFSDSIESFEFTYEEAIKNGLADVAGAPLIVSDKIPVPVKDYCNDYNMYDKNPLTGFIDDWGYCVPGLVTTEVWFTKSPEYVYGTAVLYAPGQMEGTARWRRMYNEAYGYGSEYIGGVATPSPADIGETVWLRRDSGTWEGPYLVVDCSRRADMFTHIAINQQVVEVDFETAVRWGMAHYTEKSFEIEVYLEKPVEVHYGKEKPNEHIRQYEQPIKFVDYWLENIVEFQRDSIEPNPWILEFGINPVWDLRDGNGGQCFTRECNE